MVIKDLFEEFLATCNEGPRMAALAEALAPKLLCSGEALVIMANGTCLDMEEPPTRDPAELAAYGAERLRGRVAEEYLNYVELTEVAGLYFPIAIPESTLRLAIEELDDWRQPEMRRAIDNAYDRVYMLRDEWDWQATAFTFNLAAENTVASDELELSAASIAFQNRSEDFAQPQPVCVIVDGTVTHF